MTVSKWQELQQPGSLWASPEEDSPEQSGAPRLLGARGLTASRPDAPPQSRTAAGGQILSCPRCHFQWEELPRNCFCRTGICPCSLCWWPGVLGPSAGRKLHFLKIAEQFSQGGKLISQMHRSALELELVTTTPIGGFGPGSGPTPAGPGPPLSKIVGLFENPMKATKPLLNIGRQACVLCIMSRVADPRFSVCPPG